MEGNDLIQNTVYSSNQSETANTEPHITNAPKMKYLISHNSTLRDNSFPTPFKLKCLDEKEFDSENLSFELDLNSLSPTSKGRLIIKSENALGKRGTEDILLIASRKSSQISTCNVTRDGDISPEGSFKEITILSYLKKKSGN